MMRICRVHAGSGLVLLLLCAPVIFCLPQAAAQRTKKRGMDSSSSLERSIRSLPAARVAGKHGETLVFLLRFVDFGCEVCLNNFLDFSDRLQNIAEGKRAPAVMVFEQESAGHQKRRLHRWAKACGLKFPIVFVPQGMFAENGVTHSSVAILHARGGLTRVGDLPLPMEVEAKVMNMLFYW